MKKYIILFLTLIVSCIVFGQENPAKNEVPKSKSKEWFAESWKAAKSNHVETFADAFKDPNIIIGVFEHCPPLSRTILSSGEVLEDFPGYKKAMIRFSLIQLRCVKLIKGNPPEPVILITRLGPPMIEAAPRIPPFLPLVGGKWILALQKTSKEYRIYRYDNKEIENYKFINDNTMFRVFRYGYGALYLRWADHKNVPKLKKLPEPSFITKVPEDIVDDFEAIERVMPLIRKEKKDPNEKDSINKTSKALKNDLAKSIFAKISGEKIEELHDPNNKD